MSYKPNLEQLKNSGPTFSIVIETENLGMAGLDDLQETIASLEAQTYSIKNAKEVLIIAGGHVGVETISTLRAKYPWLTIHEEQEKLIYTHAKMRGAEIATADVVVFADSDVVYENTWLENMLYAFIWAPGASIVAGETRIKISSVYRMAIQLVWMLNVNRNFSHPRSYKNFYLNNFAIRRKAMLSIPFFDKSLPLYRSMIIEWINLLKDRGYSIVQAPNAKGYHAPPGNWWDFWYRMLIFGADEVAKADFYFLPDGSVVDKFSPLRRLYKLCYYFAFKIYKIIIRTHALLREDWTNFGYLVLSIPIVLLAVLLNLSGSVISLLNRDYLFSKIFDRENEHIV